MDDMTEKHAIIDKALRERHIRFTWERDKIIVPDWDRTVWKQYFIVVPYQVFIHCKTHSYRAVFDRQTMQLCYDMRQPAQQKDEVPI
jgi:hypothetical protein